MEVIKRYDKCIWCKKPLVPIGHARLFGANHKDWEERKSHKKCWIENELKGKKTRPIPSEQPKRIMTLKL